MAQKIAVNTKAPDFNLDDYQGRSRSLVEFQNSQNIVLVFNRGFT